MRFHENGPIIPSHLLEQQVQGNVVFFCGAGVSVPAGLDTFWQLTNRIIENLRSKAARAALAQNQNFDSVFSLLVREYGRSEIDRQVHAALGGQRPKTVEHHRDIIDLSRGAGGSPQLVTTNFDRLFEQAGYELRPIVPPSLPDIELKQPIDGLVYLHGRLAELNGKEVPSYVLSSSDFGRAYLAEGWATRFVRALRENFTVVLLGYSADDPPMRYLLEGLNVRDGITYSSPIYVFTDKGPDKAEELWLERGVTPICYAPDDSHSCLWSTIATWADAAREQGKWTKSVIDLTRRRPAELKPYERGQVVQLVSSTAGAKAFADAEPPASSEWLCVFDPLVRYAKPKKLSWQDDAEEFDPQGAFGLDDDPPRPLDEHRVFPEGSRNPLAWQPGDDVHHERVGLQGWSPLWHNPLPDRLHHLARWFGTRCHEPAAVWWAAGWRNLNIHMDWFIANRLRSRQAKSMHATARRIWDLYLEARETTPMDERGDSWFELEGMVKQSGWTPSALRFLERAATPYVEISRPTLFVPRPPSEDWSAIGARDVVELNVRVLDRHGHEIEIQPELLGEIVPILRRSLVRLSSLMDETGNIFWHPPTLYPSAEAGEQYHGRKAQFILWYKRLFEALLQHDPMAAKREFESWPAGDRRVFPKLRLWAAAIPALATGNSAFSVLKSLDRDVAWDSYNHRELLFLLKARWSEFSLRQRRFVERMMETGPPKWESEKRTDYRIRKAAHGASNLRWLELNGCQLSEIGQHALSRLKEVEPSWTDEWAKAADDSYESRGGWVQEVTEIGDLNELPLSEVVDIARERTVRPFRELKHYRPFKGLVQLVPFRALAALRIAWRSGDFAIGFWQDLLSNWPDGTSLRLRRLAAHTVARLPEEQALELRYYSSDWLKKNLLDLYRASRSDTLKIFDGFLRPFLSCSPEWTKSSVGETTIRGVAQKQSEVSVGKAINSPIGHLAEALWSLTRKKARKDCRMDEALASRFQRLVSVPGHGAGHAINTLTKRLGWIGYCYPEWMRTFLLPKFKVDDPLAEGAWHGLAYNNNPLSIETWNELKGPLLTVLRGEASWQLDSHERESFVQAVVWLSRPSNPVFSFADIREVLLAIDDRERGRALWALSNCLTKHGDWNEFVKPFIENAWPRQLRFRSDETSRGFLHIAENAGAQFPDAVRTILPFVRPIPNADLFTFRLSKERGDRNSAARAHPREALLLLNAITADDRAQMPYDLRGALDTLAELEPSLKESVEYRRLRGLID